MRSSNLSRRNFVSTLAALGSLATSATGIVHAQSYPNRPIRLVVPSAAGGAPDVICRILANELVSVLGQPMIVDNKPGGGGMIGMNEITRAAPDGYTLGYGNVVTLSINRALYSKLSYNPDSLTGIALMGRVQNALVVRNGLPVKSVEDLIQYAKARPGKLTMGSAGNGTTGHLGGELFKSMTGLFITHVPYRGSPMALQDLIGGQIDIMFDNLSSVATHIKDGRVRALGVSGTVRSPLFPQIPTIQESGVKGYQTTAWGGVVGPAGMSVEIVSKLNSAINGILASSVVRERFDSLAFETLPSPPGALMSLAKAESPRWADVVVRSGAKVD
jgi:tripartite-type tricarboxylate transporter receptor subunit TctC